MTNCLRNWHLPVLKLLLVGGGVEKNVHLKDTLYTMTIVFVAIDLLLSRFSFSNFSGNEE